MADRLQVDSGISPERLRPTAAPTDTFIRPNPAGNTLQALARGLAEVNPEIGRFAGVVIQRSAAEQEAAGEAEARKLNEQGLTLAKATREGKLPMQMNPWFQAGLQEQFGRTTADAWQRQLIEDLAKDEVMQTSTNMADYEEFARSHMAEWMKENGPQKRDENFERGFGHRSDAYFNDIGRQFAARIEGRLEKNADSAHFAEIKAGIRESLKRGASVEQIAQDISRVNDDVFNQGRKGANINRTAIKAIVAAALEDPDHGLEILDLMNKVHTGPMKNGSRPLLIDSSSDAAEEYRQARQKLVDESFQNDARAAQKAEREFKAKRSLVFSGVVDEVLKKGYGANLRPYLEMVKGDDEAVKTVITLRDQLGNMDFQTDPVVANDLAARIWTEGLMGGTPGANGPVQQVDEMVIATALANKRISLEKAGYLMGQLKQAREAREGELKDIFSDPAFEDVSKGLPTRFSTDDGSLDSERGDRLENARGQLFASWFMLHKSGKAALMTPAEKREWLNVESTRIVTQQRGDDFSIVPAPAPDFPGKPQGNLSVPEADLRRAMMGEATEAFVKVLQANGVPANEEAVKEFIRQQLKLTQQKTGKNAPRSERDISIENKRKQNQQQKQQE